ncbi:MAG: response regulator, partial [Verrucomicrobiota bacterium]
CLECRIRATGIGIPQEKQSKLFDAFSQVDSSTTREYGGTGLGLAICSRLANLMGGSIWLESEALVGSTFHFTIKTMEVPSSLKDFPNFKGLHGLILDAKEKHAKALVNQLLHFGISTQICETPSQANTLIDEQRRIEFIITNRIPLKDIAALYHHANLNRGERIPFFCLFNREQFKDPALNYNDSSIIQITKPVARTKMINALQKYFDTAPRPEMQRNAITKEDPSVLGKQLPLRILVVDDNTTNQYCAHELLSRMGYEADIADNGEEAVNMSRDRNYDVVFMDVRMPIMDGLEATRRIRSEGRQMKQPHVIALTANALREDRDACFEAGMDDFIAKPVQFDSLRDCLLSIQDKISLN